MFEHLRCRETGCPPIVLEGQHREVNEASVHGLQAKILNLLGRRTGSTRAKLSDVSGVGLCGLCIVGGVQRPVPALGQVTLRKGLCVR